MRTLPVKRSQPRFFEPPAGYEELKTVYDVVVVGGGLSGVAAAVQAARLGAKVCLVQNRPVLGGNFSSEVRMQIAGATAVDQGEERFARETGIVEEIGTESRWSRWHHRDVHLEPMQDFGLLDLVVRESNIDLFLNAEAVAAVMAAEDRIAGILVDQQGSERQLYIRGRQFVEASGDGRVGASAGAEYRVGREGRDEYHESMAQPVPDEKTLGSSIMFWVRDMGHPVPFTPPEWAYSFRSEEDLPHRPHGVGEPYWWMEWGGTLDTIRDNEEIRWELTRIAFGVWDHVKNWCVDKEKAASYVLDWVGVIPGKRESRRFVGDYTLTQHDVQQAPLFEDRIAYGGWPIDLHPPNGIFDPGQPAEQHFLRQIYSIPLRACYSRNVRNLFLAGRLISVSHVALGSTRVMGTCAVIGQGVGAAAVMCVQKGIDPRALAGDPPSLGELQQILLKHDAYLIDVVNQDPADAAREAEVTASSHAALEIPAGEVERPLDGGLALSFQTTESRLDSAELFLSSRAADPCRIGATLYRATDLGDFSQGEVVGQASAEVPAAYRGWVTFRFDLDLPGGYYVLRPEACPDVDWVGSKKSDPRLRLAKLTEGNGWWTTPGCGGFRVFPLSYPSRPELVVDGVARPDRRGTHMWISDPGDPMPQWLQVTLREPAECDEVSITFDTHLDHQNYRRQVPEPECVRDYTLLGLPADGGEPFVIAQVTGNFYRRRVHRFTPRRLAGVRLEVMATNGDPSARVFEMRVYRSAK